MGGFDKLKDPYVIQQAYANKQKSFEALGRNLVDRINRELNGNLIQDNFYAHTYYDGIERRIWSTMISKIDQCFQIKGQTFCLEEGEVLRFLCSRKWKTKEIEELFEQFGFKKIGNFEDSKEYISQVYFEKK